MVKKTLGHWPFEESLGDQEKGLTSLLVGNSSTKNFMMALLGGLDYFLRGIKTCKFPMMIRKGFLEDFLGDLGPYFVFPCPYVFLMKALLVI